MAAPQQIEQVRLPLVCTCFPETWRHLSKSNKFVCLLFAHVFPKHGGTSANRTSSFAFGTCFPVRSTVKRNVIPLQGQHLNHCANQEFFDFSRASAINGSVRLATCS